MIVCPSCYHQTISEFLSNRFPYVGEAALDFHDRNCVDCKLRTGLHRRTADLGWCANPSARALLKHIARERGYGDGWASHKFRAIYHSARRGSRRSVP